jgi:hypothetical protein
MPAACAELAAASKPIKIRFFFMSHSFLPESLAYFACHETGMS